MNLGAPDEREIDRVEPSTVTEFLLKERIRELKLALWEKQGPMPPWKPQDDAPLRRISIQPTLTLAAELEAGWEKGMYRWGVKAQAHSKDGGLHFGYYMSAEQMRVWPKIEQAEALVDMHKQMIAGLGHGVKL